MFPNDLPTLDLHGYDRLSARLAITECIQDMLLIKEKEFVIIHGKGSGILRKEVAETLKKDKRVESFSLSFLNPGCTIVKLKDAVDKPKKN